MQPYLTQELFEAHWRIHSWSPPECDPYAKMRDHPLYCVDIESPRGTMFRVWTLPGRTTHIIRLESPQKTGYIRRCATLYMSHTGELKPCPART